MECTNVLKKAVVESHNMKTILFYDSLENMYKCLAKDIEGFEHPGHGYLTGWSKQGRSSAGGGGGGGVEEGERELQPHLVCSVSWQVQKWKGGGDINSCFVFNTVLSLDD